jgi:hypothetical protein
LTSNAAFSLLAAGENLPLRRRPLPAGVDMPLPDFRRRDMVAMVAWHRCKILVSKSVNQLVCFELELELDVFPPCRSAHAWPRSWARA